MPRSRKITSAIANRVWDWLLITTWFVISISDKSTSLQWAVGLLRFIQQLLQRLCRVHNLAAHADFDPCNFLFRIVASFMNDNTPQVAGGD